MAKEEEEEGEATRGEERGAYKHWKVNGENTGPQETGVTTRANNTPWPNE